MKECLQCAIYTRVSTNNQVEIEYNSCETQEDKIRSFINSQENMVVYKTYSDPGFTGANLDRPALDQMFQDIKEGRINIVIVYKIDRLTRSPKDFYQIMDFFEEHGVSFISVTERFDTSTPSGRLMRNMLLTFAQFERELASERTKDKMYQRAQKGLWNGGTAPYGYGRRDKKLIIDEREAEVVRAIYTYYIEYGSLAFVYKILKEKEIVDRKGAMISKSSIWRILRNVAYVGKVHYGGNTYQGLHEPIISEEVYELAQQVHKQKERFMRLYKNFPLGGILKCSECGSKMTPCFTNKKNNGKRNRYYYYRCTKTFKYDWQSCSTRHVSAPRLENYIFENLERISLDKHYIDSLIYKLNSDKSDDQTGLEPPEVCPPFSSETFENSLKIFLSGLSDKKGVEKNIWVKKFIKQIDYAKDQIALTLYYINNFGKDFVSEGFLKTSPPPPSFKTEKISPVVHGTLNLSSPPTGLEPVT